MSFDLEQHLQDEHSRSPFSNYLKEIMYGGVDGIITTFAVVAGFSGAQAMDGAHGLPIVAVLLFGFANLFADAASMGLGNFLSVRADQDVYVKEKKKELTEIRTNPSMEIEETVALLMARGFSQKDAETVTQIYSQHEEPWVEFMMQNELQMSNPHEDNPFITGFSTFLAFIIFGGIPLSPYIFLSTAPIDTFHLSIFFTCTALLLLGIFRWKVTQQKITRSILETLLVGSVSAIIAYTVGTFFRL